MKVFLLLTLFILAPAWVLVSVGQQAPPQKTKGQSPKHRTRRIGEVHEGIASYYAEKFRGRKTHTDEIYSPEKLTAACNILPLKTWIKVTNLRNKRTITLWINDRMNPKNKRLIDVSARAAMELGFYARGLTRVKVEVVERPVKKP